MSLFRLIARSLREHLLSSAITAGSVALAAGLLMAVWAVREEAQSAFTRMDGGFDAVLGARSSKLQLVLNAIFHLEASPANVAWDDYKEIEKDPRILRALPIAMGDNFRGHRVVGTLPELFTRSRPCS
jgi:putative ABC transport system permease protein